jgi:DNA-binding transcriptional LysR family regulator
MQPEPSYDSTKLFIRQSWRPTGSWGFLRIGFISTAGNEIVPTIVRQFRELNAEVEFSLRNILTTDQIQIET